MKISKLIPLAAAVGLAWAGSASAAPVIGFDYTGSGTFGPGCPTCFYASTLTNITDTGEDTSTSPTPLAVGAVHTFTTQAAVGTATNNGTPTTPALLNVNTPAGFEITKEIKFNDIVTSTSTNGTSTTLNFGQLANVGPNLSMYLDHLGDGTQAVRAGPPTNPSAADCYGAGSACAGAGSDGVLVLQGHIIANDSSFTFNPTTNSGNGSFQVTFAIDFFNPLYVDVSNLLIDGGTGQAIISDIFTGSLVQPADAAHLGFNPPTHVWDGTAFVSTPTGSANAFKVDSSQTFGVPEPTTVALLGFGAAAFGFARRGKKKS